MKGVALLVPEAHRVYLDIRKVPAKRFIRAIYGMQGLVLSVGFKVLLGM